MSFYESRPPPKPLHFAPTPMNGWKNFKAGKVAPGAIGIELPVEFKGPIGVRSTNTAKSWAEWRKMEAKKQRVEAKKQRVKAKKQRLEAKRKTKEAAAAEDPKRQRTQ